MTYPLDKRAVKCLVYGVCILDMLQTGFTTQSLWFYCVQNWGNIEVFSDSVFIWTASILPIMAGLIAMTVQLFYAWRIWSLGGRWLKACSVAIGMIAITEGLSAFIGGIKYDIIASSVIPPATVPYFVIWLSGSFTCDVLIAGSMTVIFVEAKTRSHFGKTNSVINILIRHVVETAAITAFCAGVELVLFIKTRNESLAHTAPAFVLGKLYTNCLLANLNNRRHLTSNGNSEGSGDVINSFQLRKLRPFCEKNQNSAVVDLTTIRVDRLVERDEGESSATADDVDNKQLDQEGNYKGNASDMAFAYKLEGETVSTVV